MPEHGKTTGANDDVALPGSHGSNAHNHVNGAHSVSAGRLSLARGILARRRSRAEMLDPAMFGEPAWDMLLALYVADGARLSRAHLTDAVPVHPSVAVRWQEYLERAGLVEVIQIFDGEASLLQLAPKGQDALDRYLTHVADS